MASSLARVRNIGISAHIDAGKTTLSERVLFYTERIHAMHEVKGKDGAGATMDFMDLERERGITITSAATRCTWADHQINLIDTPGHVDFTIEVERALRVLDGAVLVLCAVGGVQSQTITVDRQMARYGVPAIAFVNKCDRTGANPLKVVDQLRDKLGHDALALQLPIGLESGFSGLIDLVHEQALFFDGPHGQTVRRAPIPPELAAAAAKAREQLIEGVALHSEIMTEAALSDRVTPQLLLQEIRAAALGRHLTPVLMGSAYKNKGVQPLLDAITAYLPSPLDKKVQALDRDGGPVPLSADAEQKLVSLAFKLEDGPYGQLTFVRVYQGRLRRGETVVNTRTGQQHRVGRVIYMHADQMEDVDELAAGDIGALFGIPCHSGDTFAAPGLELAMSAMHVPAPVISVAIKAADEKSRANLPKAISRFTKEDPTLTYKVDEQSQEMVLSGMGELHLEIYIERMRREYHVQVQTGAPQVAYREAITQRAEFDYIHKKQTGGAGQYGRVIGYVEPTHEKDYDFVDDVRGGTVPTQFVPAVERGFKTCLQKGLLLGRPVAGLKVVLQDGNSHAVDSSDMAFAAAARGAFRQVYGRAKPVLQEPIMKVVVETPAAFQGAVLGSLSQRRGLILGTQDEGLHTVIEAQVPLADMFGYATVLRSLSQGQAAFSMEFASYKQVPASIAAALIERWQKETGRTSLAGTGADDAEA